MNFIESKDSFQALQNMTRLIKTVEKNYYYLDNIKNGVFILQHISNFDILFCFFCYSKEIQSFMFFQSRSYDKLNLFVFN